jgi:hypothetical protein
MEDRLDPIIGDHRPHQRPVTNRSGDERDIIWNTGPETGGEIIENDNWLARLVQRMREVTSDVTGATRYHD